MFYTIELFAGAGGFALGIEEAGFETLGLVEFDKDAADTLKGKKRKIFELVPAGGYWRDIDPQISKEYMKSCWNMEGANRDFAKDEPGRTVIDSIDITVSKADRALPSIGGKAFRNQRKCKMSDISG